MREGRLRDDDDRDLFMEEKTSVSMHSPTGQKIPSRIVDALNLACSVIEKSRYRSHDARAKPIMLISDINRSH